MDDWDDGISGPRIPDRQGIAARGYPQLHLRAGFHPPVVILGSFRFTGHALRLGVSIIALGQAKIAGTEEDWCGGG